MLQVVVHAQEIGMEQVARWTLFYEDGIEKGRLGLSMEGTEQLTGVLRNASIPVTDLTEVVESVEDDEEPV